MHNIFIIYYYYSREVSDLEMVLNKQKEENRKKRRKKVDSEELNDMDNLISNFISEMKNVASVRISI